MNVTLPDGTTIQGVPDGTTQAQLLQKLQANGHPAAKSLGHAMAQSQVANDPISMGAKNFAQDMPAGKQFLAGYGKVMPDLIAGAKQLVGAGDQGEIDEQKRLDAPLMKTGAGLAGNIAGSAVTYAPTAMIPGAGSLVGAGLIGAGVGAAQPVATGDSRATNAALGAVGGAGGQLLGRGIGRAIRPVEQSLNPQEQALAAAAAKEGIPLTAGQQTGSRPLQIAESVMENLPLTSASQLGKKEAQQRAFTAAALKKGGMSGDVADAGTMLTQKRALGSTMEGVAANNSVDFTQRGINAELSRILSDASAHLPPAEASKLSGTVDQILKQVGPGGAMEGTNYQGWREPLRSMAKQGDAPSRYYGQIRKTLDDAFAGGLSGADADTFKTASRQYANTKTIIDAMGGPGALPAKGQLPPSQLGAALGRSVGRENKALGVGDLNELSRVGQTFVKDQIPNSGTAQRQLIQSMLTTGGAPVGGGVVGGAAAAGTGNDPIKGAMYGAALGAGTAAIPRAIQMLMNSPAGQAYLTKGVLPVDAAQRAALARALQIGGMGAIPALTQ